MENQMWNNDIGYRTGPTYWIHERNEISGHHKFQNSFSEVVTGFTPVMVQCIHQTQGSLTYQMPPMYFSKEHVMIVIY